MKKNLLKDLRGAKSQSEIAKEYEVSQQCWQSWESGRTVPDNATMLQMEKILTSLWKLFFLIHLTTKHRNTDTGAARR